MDESTLVKYEMRFEEKYDIQDDVLYNAWSKLKQKVLPHLPNSDREAAKDLDPSNSLPECVSLISPAVMKFCSIQTQCHARQVNMAVVLHRCHDTSPVTKSFNSWQRRRIRRTWRRIRLKLTGRLHVNQRNVNENASKQKGQQVGDEGEDRGDDAQDGG